MSAPRTRDPEPTNHGGLVARRTLATAALAAPLAGLLPTPARAATFVDVPPGAPFHTEIEWAAAQGITTGWPDRTFRPTLPIERGAMAAFLYRFTGSPPFSVASQSFYDVKAGTPFRTEIEWLSDTRITTGWPDRTFRPFNPVNRDAMAAYLHRLAGSPAFTPTRRTFPDVGPSEQFYREIEWLASTGIASGWDDGTFRPLQPVQRDAMAAFLHRFHARFGRPTPPRSQGPLPPLPPHPRGYTDTITPVTGGVYIRLGWNGTRVYLVQKRLGMERYGSDQTYDAATRDRVVAFQRSRGLDPDGVVGPATWNALGTGWPFTMDAYQVQPQLPYHATAGERTEKLIEYALAQRGSRYTWGGAGPYALGFDCSGLVLQAIYAAGRDPQPIDVIKHAEPAYRTSRELYAHPALLSVPLAQRRRGDLLFFTNSAGTVHHVAIDLGDGTMMEAYGRYAAIRRITYRYGISYIAPYVKRVFP